MNGDPSAIRHCQWRLRTARWLSWLSGTVRPDSFHAAILRSWACAQVRLRCTFMASLRLAETFLSNLSSWRPSFRPGVDRDLPHPSAHRFPLSPHRRADPHPLISMKECATGVMALIMPSWESTSSMLSVQATSSSSVLSFRSELRFCSDCFDNRAPSFNSVPEVVVGIVTRVAAGAASSCTNLLVVCCVGPFHRSQDSLPPHQVVCSEPWKTGRLRDIPFSRRRRVRRCPVERVLSGIPRRLCIIPPVAC